MKQCLYARAGLALLLAAFPALANDSRETGTILAPRGFSPARRPSQGGRR